MTLVNAAHCADLGGAIDSKQVLEFIDEGGNVLLAVDEGVSASLRDIATQAGIDLALPKDKVLDHFNKHGSDDASVILTNDITPSTGIFGADGVQVAPLSCLSQLPYPHPTPTTSKPPQQGPPSPVPLLTSPSSWADCEPGLRTGPRHLQRHRRLAVLGVGAGKPPPPPPIPPPSPTLPPTSKHHRRPSHQRGWEG